MYTTYRAAAATKRIEGFELESKNMVWTWVLPMDHRSFLDRWGRRFLLSKLHQRDCYNDHRCLLYCSTFLCLQLSLLFYVNSEDIARDLQLEDVWNTASSSEAMVNRLSSYNQSNRDLRSSTPFRLKKKRPIVGKVWVSWTRDNGCTHQEVTFLKHPVTSPGPK